MKQYAFDDISEPLGSLLVPPVDRDIPEADLTPDQKKWRDDGVLILENFLPDDVMDAYVDCWSRENGPLGAGVPSRRPGGWPDCCPYMRHPEIMNLGLYTPLAQKLEELLSEPAGMHLNLTGFVSTERKFHQDSYLNPPNVGAWYIAAWMALGDIDPNSGPFQYVPGSHRWPTIRRDSLFTQLPLEVVRDPRWPSLTQDRIEELLLEEIEKRGAEIVEFLPKRGTLLLWHSSLVHRGSKPKIPGTIRPSFISHYSAISKRPDFPPARKHPSTAGWYFPIVTDTPV